MLARCANVEKNNAALVALSVEAAWTETLLNAVSIGNMAKSEALSTAAMLNLPEEQQHELNARLQQSIQVVPMHRQPLAHSCAAVESGLLRDLELWVESLGQ